MNDLIKALQIFLTYNNSKYPTYCEHDTLYIMDIEPDDVSIEDKRELDNLGFFVSEDDECFISSRFGSA